MLPAIHYVGMIRSPVSWSQVGREMIRALNRLGCRLSVSSLRGLLYDPAFPLPMDIESLITLPRSTGMDIAFIFPPLYKRLKGRLKAGLLVYESSKLPAAWSRAILDYLDLLVVPSRFCADIMENNGIPPDMIRIVPYGYDPEVFHPSGKIREKIGPASPFTFLTIALPHRRKGLDILVDAFFKAFTADDPVKLILKILYRPSQKKRRAHWEEEDIQTLIEAHPSPSGNRPMLEIISKTLTPEGMVALYDHCDCYIQPSRSEGFGLALLEAAACGKPLIAGDQGGHRDFLGPGNSFLIRTGEVKAGPIQYDCRDPEATTYLPDTAHLRELMRRAYTHPDKAAAMGQRARASTAHLTWDHAAALLIKTLNT